MRTVQMTLDEQLLRRVDRAVKETRTTRSSFVRLALNEALRRLQADRLEAKHRAGYLKNPVSANEFSGWEAEQKWGDE
jgi:metal-responsive CopG/Arc/MetJ family transcriptional regulator